MSGADYTRIHDPERTEHFIYRLLDKGGQVLYIGCSMNLGSRLAEHRRNGNFGHLFKTHDAFGPYTYAEARRIERQWIGIEQPPFNVEWTVREERGIALHRRRSPLFPQYGRRVA